MRVIAALFTTALIIGALHQIKPHASRALNYPCSSSGSREIDIDIASGESGSSIAQQLFEKGVVQSSASFFRLAVADPRAGRISAGVHRVQTRLCAQDALTQLLDSARISNLLKITEGEWNREIKTSIISLGFSQSDITGAFKALKLPKGYHSSEGLLFPAQYSFETSTQLTTLLQSVVDRGVSELSKSGIAQGTSEFTPQQLLTIASLVQAEGNTEDFRNISRVIRNRLSKGMPLQLDSTVHYIKGTRGSMFLSTKSTFVNSPYNTYRHYGLPPTPINNPGSSAMKAAVNPAAGDWLYFITVAPGDTRFTSTLDQFNTWKILYKKNLRNGLFNK